MTQPNNRFAKQDKRKRTFDFDSTPMGKKSIEIQPAKPPAEPTVFYTKEVWDSIWYIVDQCKKEVGWLGLVEELANGDYLITEIFVPKQEVTSVTTEMEPEALAKLAMQLLDEDKDPSKLRYWGHSHVDMPVRPSATDEDQVDEYLEHADWFIRGIYNKKGDTKVDVYDMRVNFLYTCVDDRLDLPPVDETLKDKIDAELKANVTEPPRVSRWSWDDDEYPGFGYQGYGFNSYGARTNSGKKPVEAEAKTDASVKADTANRLLAVDTANLTIEEEQELLDILSDPFYVGEE